MKNVLAVGIAVVSLIGCASQAHTEKVAIEAALKQAEFDLDCEDITAQRIGEFSYLGQQRNGALVSIGAKGMRQKGKL